MGEYKSKNGNVFCLFGTGFLDECVLAEVTLTFYIMLGLEF